jgi:hypothetical protein
VDQGQQLVQVQAPRHHAGRQGACKQVHQHRLAAAHRTPQVGALDGRRGGGRLRAICLGIARRGGRGEAGGERGLQQPQCLGGGELARIWLDRALAYQPVGGF